MRMGTSYAGGQFVLFSVRVPHLYFTGSTRAGRFRFELRMHCTLRIAYAV